MLGPRGLDFRFGVVQDLAAQYGLPDVQIPVDGPLPLVSFSSSGERQRSRREQSTAAFAQLTPASTNTADEISLGVDETAPEADTTCKQDGHFALTFDDGPVFFRTSRVVEALKPWGAKATFFELGNAWGTNCLQPKFFGECEALWKAMLADGHTIGYHSWRHTDIGSTDMSTIADETAKGQLGFARFMGHHGLIFRPPNGATGTGSPPHRYFTSLGYRFVNWNLHTQDWTFALDLWDDAIKPGAKKTVLGIIDNALASHAQARLGSHEWKAAQSNVKTPYIALLHDTDANVWLDYFDEILQKITKAGYTAVNMATCLGLPFEQVYASQGLKYKAAVMAEENPCGSSEGGRWLLWEGVDDKPPMFQPICIRSDTCKQWGYQESIKGAVAQCMIP